MLLNIKDYNKLILKKIIILIPKYKENMLSFLAPIIGIYGIKINLFIEDFENKTENFDIDLIIPLEVIIYKINTFEIIVKLPYINYFLNEFYNNLNILYIYKFSIIKSLYSFLFLLINYKLIRSYINSINIIKNNFNLIKYKFFIINNYYTFYKFKNLLINFYYKLYFLKYNFSLFIYINNINYYKLLNNNIHLNFLKIKKFSNLYLINFNNTENIIYFINNISLFIKNKYNILFIKYKINKINIKFFIKNFNKIINFKIYYILNLLKFYINKFYKIFNFNLNFLKFINANFSSNIKNI
jgi:hypothetical protein